MAQYWVLVHAVSWNSLIGSVPLSQPRNGPANSSNLGRRAGGLEGGPFRASVRTREMRKSENKYFLLWELSSDEDRNAALRRLASGAAWNYQLQVCNRLLAIHDPIGS
jgi:hypothetical protein